MSFDVLTSPRRVSVDQLAIEVPDGWQQGRGAFGGFVAAVLARSMMVVHGDAERPLRTLHVQFAGPALPGMADVEARCARPGTGVSFWEARLTQGAEVVAQAMATFGRRRVADGTWLTAAPPTAPAWDRVSPLELAPPLGPAFALHFEYRPCLGALPMAGRADAPAVTGGWIRARRPGVARDAAYAAALLDGWWPSAYARLATMRPMATIAYAMQVVDGFEGLDPAGPYLLHCRSDAARDGYCVEQRELWGQDGRLIASNHQTMALLA